MSPEFSGNRPIEVITNPIRYEKAHRIMVNETSREMQRAGKNVKALWQSFIDCGIQDAFRKAHVEGDIAEFTARDSDGNNAWHKVFHKFSAVDEYTQPIDAFRVVKENPDRNEPPAIIEISTYKERNSSYRQLVSMETIEEAEEVPCHLFYFVAGDLSIILQIAEPQVLFPAVEQRRQFFLVTRKPSRSELEVEVGLVGDTGLAVHSYQYTDGITTSNRLRVEDSFTGQIELVSINGQGIIDEPATFNLPKAVANIGNFKPAIVSAA